MIDYGIQKSTVKPKEVEILESKVFVASDIKDTEETINGETVKGFEFNLKGYEKDEYIQHQNDDLSSQMTNAQMALCDIYELVGGES